MHDGKPLPGLGPTGPWAIDLGVREYGECWALQKRLVARRQAGEIPDVLLLVEHPHVVTVGRRAEAQRNVLERSMPVFEVERGGDATYHGPGQLVGYPILRLDGDERDLHALLRNLEAGLIETCRAFGLDGRRRAGWTGVWVPTAAGERKVASIGIAVRRWVTLHGFALNVATELARFAALKPCGLDAQMMTSLSEAAGRAISVAEVRQTAAACVGTALGRVWTAALPSAVDGP